MPRPTSPPPASLRSASASFAHDGAAPLSLSSALRTRSSAASLSSLHIRSAYANNPAVSGHYALNSSPSTSRATSLRDSGASTPVVAPKISALHGGSTLLSTVGDGNCLSAIPSLCTPSFEAKQTILRAFAPNVAVLASSDLDDMLNERGFGNGFLELIRPFGETIQGKVTIRGGTGASSSWLDYGVRFVSIKEVATSLSQHAPDHAFRSTTSGIDPSTSKPNPAEHGSRGGNILEIDQVLQRHLDLAEFSPSSSHQQPLPLPHNSSLPRSSMSPFYSLFLNRMFSALPLSPHETFSHPVACIIAISSRNPAPIEEFNRLYDSTTSTYCFPPWAHNDYLRYYVLVHDEDNDDMTKSLALYDKIKMNSKLNCHLLRLRSAQCLPSDDDSVKLPAVEWMAAGEELSLFHLSGSSHPNSSLIEKLYLQVEILVIQDHGLVSENTVDGSQNAAPYLLDTEATALRLFVHEMVTQAIIPFMEKHCMLWNEILKKRQGFSLTGQFKKTFGYLGTAGRSKSRARASYNTATGAYNFQSEEALLRKLGDYAFMLRDYKTAQSAYDVVRSDFEQDSAWKYHAGASEMGLVATLLNPMSVSKLLARLPRSKKLSIEEWLEASYHSYIHKSRAPFYGLRSLILAAECLQFNASLGVDEPASWLARAIDLGLPGPVAKALISERISSIFATKLTIQSTLGSRSRKQGLWSLIATERWLRLGNTAQAESCLHGADLAYGMTSKGSSLNDVQMQIQLLRDEITKRRLMVVMERNTSRLDTNSTTKDHVKLTMDDEDDNDGQRDNNDNETEIQRGSDNAND